MRRTYLGEFEEIVLWLVAILDGEAYGVTVSQALEDIQQLRTQLWQLMPPTCNSVWYEIVKFNEP